MTKQITTEQKLNLETATIAWKDLQLFFAQGKLITVEFGSDLVRVAGLIADNSIPEIESLIESQKISFATPDWIKKNCKEETLLWAVVISPYVVCQLITD